MKENPVLRVTAVGRFVSGISPAIQRIDLALADIARTDIPVLLAGESGTGKELYARVIHELSAVSLGAFKKVNCITQDAESFRNQVPPNTNEDRRGTLFLDEISEMDLGCQRLLLTMLLDGHATSGEAVLSSRLICATSRDLGQEIDTGRFRSELYYRINGVCINLPPLRERKEDIPALLNYFLPDYSEQLKRPIPVLSSSEMEFLTSYDWPGNIRELENVAKKIVALGRTEIALGDLRKGSNSLAVSKHPKGASSLKEAARAASRRTERELILKALERTRWNRKRAAQELQISYKSLLNKLKDIGTIDESIKES